LTMLIVNFVDRADVWVIQGRGGLRFTLETGEGLGISGDLIGKKLQGHEAVQLHILGFVNHTHSASANPLYDAVVRNGWRISESVAGMWGTS